MKKNNQDRKAPCNVYKRLLKELRKRGQEEIKERRKASLSIRIEDWGVK